MPSSQHLEAAPLSEKRHILILQPMIGIGDMIWVKPWIDETIRRHNVTLMVKPSSHAQFIMQEHKLDLRMLHRSQTGGVKAGMMAFSDFSGL